MSMTYASYKTSISTLVVVPEIDPNFIAIFPEVIAYAEGRIYREVDFLATRGRDASAALTTNQRTFVLPSGFLVVEGLNVITPAGQAPDAGTRNPLAPVSRDYIDAVYPNLTTSTGVPSVFAMLTNETVVVGPAPDASYTVEVVGVQVQTPLSASETETVITTWLPDLFLAASMVFMSGYMKNFGSQADDPAMAVSWEQQYQVLLKSALTVEFRKKFESTNYTSKAPTPLSKPRN